jgi:uncharacterized protein YciI
MPCYQDFVTLREVPMPFFAVILEDEPQRADEIRRAFMPAHLEFLTRHAGVIRAAGPLRPTDDEAAGGLWLVEAPDAAAVKALTREDPFWAAGLRRTIRIQQWARVFADGRRLEPGPRPGSETEP